MIPIGIRTRNRPVYLDTTLRSLTNTRLPDDVEILILDDCSDDPTTQRYLFTDGEVNLPQTFRWPESDSWKKMVGDLPTVESLSALGGRISVIQPESRKGVRGGIFWCIDTLMTRYPTEPFVMVIEGDAVFHEDWLVETLKVYTECLDKKGPNGDRLGLLTAYDRKPKSVPKSRGWTWRSVKKLSNGNWGCGNGIGGVHYLVTRSLYDASLPAMRATYNPSTRSGDTALQAVCGTHGFTIAATVPSYIQHIGVDSLAWPQKGWRHARNFLRPFAWGPVRA